MSARTLVYDIECSPIVAYTWDLRPKFLPIENIVENPRILCIGAMWLGEKKVTLLSEWQHGRQGMLEGIRELFDQADVVAGFNSKSFDTPWVQGELAREGFAPPSPFTQVDLYRESKQFRLPSHRLQYISTEVFKLSGKMSTGGFGLWRAVLDGDEKAQARMARYCRQDVRLTGELYEQMLPWLKTAPIPSLYAEDDGGLPKCPRCDSENVTRQGYSYTKLAKYRSYRCNDCRSWSRGKRAVVSADLRGVS